MSVSGGETGVGPDRRGRGLRISVVVPARDAAGELGDCLAALAASEERAAEVLVVDDGSRDDTAAVAISAGAVLGARLLRRRTPGGPAVARNLGAARAGGDIVLFVDADVAVAPGAIGRVRRTLEESPDLAAVFGSYDAWPRAPGLVSQYRNLLHHYVHQRGNADAFTFWAGCGAVRRAAFAGVGGFDERRRRHFIEDIELGHRLRAAGHRIRLDRDLQGTHLKRWTLRRMVRTDLLHRAVPWARLLAETAHAPADLNLGVGQRVSVAAIALALVALPLALHRGEFAWLGLGALLLATVVNHDLYRFLARQRGAAFAVASVPLHWLHFLCGGLGLVWGRLRAPPA